MTGHKEMQINFIFSSFVLEKKLYKVAPKLEGISLLHTLQF